MRTIVISDDLARVAENLLREHEDNKVYLIIPVRQILKKVARPEEINNLRHV